MLLSLDIGTTNVKAVAFGEAGGVLATAERHNAVLVAQPGWSEQEPAAILQNLREVLAEVLVETQQREPVQGLVFSAAMHGLIALDSSGKPLTNIWLWSDLRAAELAVALRQSATGMEIYQRTGVPIHPMSLLLKLLWMRQNQPDIFIKAYKFVGIKEYLLLQLLGKCLVDLPVASATGLLNIHRHCWDDQALALAEIQATQLSDIVPPTHIEALPDVAARALGLPTGLPVVIGGSDGALANLGAGATAPGHYAVTIGTSAAIRMVTDKPVTDAQMRNFCYCLDEDRYIVGGASNNGANALEWLRNMVIGSRRTAGTFAGLAATAPAGAAGLLFLPYLLGERAPLWDATARGSFQGLTAQHIQAHFVRAVMEGVLFNLKIIAGPLEAAQSIEVIHAGGGFSNSRLWVQLLADIFQKPVSLDQRGVDSSVLGALIIGRQALGLPKSGISQKTVLIQPDVQQAVLYQAAYRRFEALVLADN